MPKRATLIFHDDTGRAVALDAVALATFMTEAVGVLQEFVKDVQAVGTKKVAEEWPDLMVTYRRAWVLLNPDKART